LLSCERHQQHPSIYPSTTTAAEEQEQLTIQDERSILISGSWSSGSGELNLIHLFIGQQLERHHQNVSSLIRPSFDYYGSSCVSTTLELHGTAKLGEFPQTTQFISS